MFQFQTMTSKRRRDDDSDSDEERNFKKSRPIYIAHLNHGFAHSPLHINVGPSLPPSPPTASHAEALATAHQPSHPWGGPVQSSTSSPHWTDMDYSMDLSEDDLDSQSDVRSQPPESPFGGHFFRPPTLHPSSSHLSEHSNSTGRIPTPIHSTFNRGSMGMNGFGYPSSGAAGGVTSAASPSLSGSGLSVRKNRQAHQDAPTSHSDLLPRSRRMPSPISEDDDNIPDTPTAFTQSQLQRLSFSGEDDVMDGMDMEEEGERIEEPRVVPTTPLTPRGRKRSGALTGVTPGRFSMGFREDCEKCRMKVPGHYAHFLP
ncbi:hypothetical protein E8E13_006586 [Curvularia kusanoi]|uniref:Uncharacterized protein n=1 Tax=Curvularia kusanoi TaxID=90978 RepID=A0A9P4T947_CURKU|nr:hypothetical protein E8E13_006586 [Curvularia kusanoi]